MCARMCDLVKRDDSEPMRSWVRGNGISAVFTSLDLKLFPCMPCFQKARTLSWRHTEQEETARYQTANKKQVGEKLGKIGFSDVC